MNKYEEALKVIMDDTCHIGELGEPIKVIKELVDKETPMKPDFVYEDEPMCPNANCVLCLDWHVDRCENCNQKIDWSYEE